MTDFDVIDPRDPLAQLTAFDSTIPEGAVDEEAPAAWRALNEARVIDFNSGPRGRERNR